MRPCDLLVKALQRGVGCLTRTVDRTGALVAILGSTIKRYDLGFRHLLRLRGESVEGWSFVYVHLKVEYQVVLVVQQPHGKLVLSGSL